MPPEDNGEHNLKRMKSLVFTDLSSNSPFESSFPIISTNSPSSEKNPENLGVGFEIFCAEIVKNNTPINRNEYVKRLADEGNRRDPETNSVLELVTELQLLDAFDFILANQAAIKEDLNNSLSGIVRIARKIPLRNDKYNNADLPFSMEIQRNDDGHIAAYLLPKSKIGEVYRDPDLKSRGASKSVTPRILINPQDSNEKLLATISKKTYDVLAAQREGLLLHAIFRSNFKIGSIYIDSYQDSAVNTSEPAALGDLTQLVNKDTRMALLQKDHSYNVLHPLASEYDIIVKLIHDILISIKQVHDAGIIHNDIKDPNILVFIDSDGHLTAQVADFDLAVYQNKQLTQEKFNAKLSKLNSKYAAGNISEDEFISKAYNLEQDFFHSQPIATSAYAAPEVVSYMLQRSYYNLPTNYTSLSDEFRKKSSENMWRYYGVQLVTSDKYLMQPQHMQLQSSPKDDMFSIGITLFMLITGHYPCINAELNGRGAFSAGHPPFPVKYLDLDTAVNEYPLMKNFAPLILQLLAPKRDQRLDAAQAVEIFKNLNQEPKGYKML